ncbi:MAG: energy-coupling factor transporter transmembrane protein EcfT [Clostridiales bacterium]|jgi:energy-coupling factor transport system permease protein|nr:energy-coupling factor transporter transmembrane protein EcfT [Clostridiales bacterium]
MPRKEAWGAVFKDITLGQYFPEDSILHRLDARIKLGICFALLIVIFMLKSYLQYGIMMLAIFILILMSKVPLSLYLKSLRPMVILILFTGIINMLMTDGQVIYQFWVFKITYEGVTMAAQMLLRIVLLVVASAILTYTTSPIVLTGALESLLKPLRVFKFPAHEVAMMMTIALRFIPTLIDEADKIIKAQTSRGADFSTGSPMVRAKALVPVLIPLFVNSFRRADELAVAMEARCYNGGDGRTSLHVPRIIARDYVACAVCVLVCAGVLVVNYY